MKRKVCVVTGTRAEYGLLRWVLEGLRAAEDLTLQLLVTGAHLSPEFGNTYREIEADGFVIDARVEMLLSADTQSATTKAMGLGLIGMADALARLQPDMMVVLGDRYEILAAATAAMIAGIPIAHIHGGETSEGAIDEAIRHSVTKMSHLHFVAAAAYRDRVLQLGEDPQRVFLVGGLGVDAIGRVEPMNREALEASLAFTFGARNLLVTFHPATLSGAGSATQFAELLKALHGLHDTHLIFTMPNADPGNRELARHVAEFVDAHPHARAFDSLGQRRYLSCLRFVDGVVGNSSSGLAEAPSFRIGTVNIGDRQKGRLKASSVIDCEATCEAIGEAIARLYTPAFRQTLGTTRNPYGDGGAAPRIVEVLRQHPLQGLLHKAFNDLAVA